MGGFRSSQPLFDRRITWGFILVVVLCALLAGGMAVNLTRPRTRHLTLPLAATPDQATPQNALQVSAPTRVGTAAFQLISSGEETPGADTQSMWTPVPIVPTFTPRPQPGRYVTWLYWYVRPNSIRLGECVQITWETQNAASLKLYRDQKLILDNAPFAHTYQDCPVQGGYTVYRMVGVNHSNESNWIQLQVRVRNP